MIEGYNAVFQTFLGTLFTWGLTALGSALVFVFQSGQRKILDGSLGFAGGVMIAASYWSLLDPALEFASKSGLYGDKGQWAFVPVTVGFVLGAVFVYGADVLMPYLGSISTTEAAIEMESMPKRDENDIVQLDLADQEQVVGTGVMRHDSSIPRRRQPGGYPGNMTDGFQLSTANISDGGFQFSNSVPAFDPSLPGGKIKASSWKRILLLIIAITVHNIPEGLAVGVGFGAIGKTASATFENARNLAIGIGIQNFPEGLAVSLPLRGAGLSPLKSFWYGQLSGMVEPIAGLFGAAAVVVAEPILPYALAFAAGAMIYVVVDDIVPESQTCGNGKLASWGCVVGFAVMMALDCGLG